MPITGYTTFDPITGMQVTVRLAARGGRRCGTTPLQGGQSRNHRWFLVPTYRTASGHGWHYKWDEALPEDYRTLKEALRAAGKLP